MSKPGLLIDRTLAVRVLIAQALAAVLVALGMLAVDTEAARCALWGGFIATLSNSYFAIRAYTYSGARSARLMVNAFYKGVSGKLVISATLFILAFRFDAGLQDSDNVFALFIGFIAALAVHWSASLWLGRQRS